jgi:hypothetical protein
MKIVIYIFKKMVLCMLSTISELVQVNFRVILVNNRCQLGKKLKCERKRGVLNKNGKMRCQIVNVKSDSVNQELILPCGRGGEAGVSF